MDLETHTIINVRLFDYKSFRHYGGREIRAIPHICPAIYLDDFGINGKLVKLQADCIGYKKDHIITVMNKDFNIQ